MSIVIFRLHRVCCGPLHAMYSLCRCQAGYYGDPVLGSGDHCRPCPCPDGPESGRQFASGCYQDPVTLQVTCVCSVGYIGTWWLRGAGLVELNLLLRRGLFMQVVGWTAAPAPGCCWWRLAALGVCQGSTNCAGDAGTTMNLIPGSMIRDDSRLAVVGRAAAELRGQAHRQLAAVPCLGAANCFEQDSVNMPPINGLCCLASVLLFTGLRTSKL